MAEVDYFLRIDGIQGESQDSKHKGEIDVESWSWGETNSGSHGGGGGGAGRVDFQDFQFVSRTSKASPQLFLACAAGTHLKEADLTCRKAGKEQQEFLRLQFSDVIVSSFEIGGQTADLVPMDQVSLAFSKVQVEYKTQNPDGTLGPATRAGWDQKQNKSF